jgi:poly-gamma-glutamate synthesis protein (capsule biosynthesis protein)
MLDIVDEARSRFDFMIVLAHWGDEYATAPRQADADFAHALIEAGAGAVIGHHPHVLQGIETYIARDQRPALIAYSLGNFLSNQARTYIGGQAPDRAGEPRDSLILSLSVVATDYGPGGLAVELKDVGAIPVWSENNTLYVRSGAARALVIRPQVIDHDLACLDQQMAALAQQGDAVSSGQKRDWQGLLKRRDLLARRRALIEARLSEDYLIAPPAQPNSCAPATPTPSPTPTPTHTPPATPAPTSTPTVTPNAAPSVTPTAVP